MVTHIVMPTRNDMKADTEGTIITALSLAIFRLSSTMILLIICVILFSPKIFPLQRRRSKHQLQTAMKTTIVEVILRVT